MLLRVCHQANVPRSRAAPCRRPSGAATARESIFDLADRLRGRVQFTTLGFGAYPKAVMDALAGDVDYASLTKLSGEPKGL